MEKTIKLPEDIFEKIRSIRESYNKNIVELGSIRLETIKTELTLNMLKDEEKRVLTDMDKISTQQKELADHIFETYGPGEIDLEKKLYYVLENEKND